MLRRNGVLLVAIAAIVAGIGVTTAQAGTSGSGVISASGPTGTTYTLVVSSTGDTIHCMRYFAPTPVTVVSASGAGTTSVLAGGVGFGAQGLSLAAGQTASFTFTTTGTISASNDGTLHLSTDCVNDVTGTLSGPTAPPPKTPCNCISLYGRVLPKSITLTNPGEEGGLHMEFDVAWTMTCTTGSGGCAGQLEILPPQPALALKARMKPLSGRVSCVTDCGTSKSGVMHFTLIVGSPKLGNSGRKGKAITLTVKRTCQGKNVKPQKFVFVFNKLSLVDKGKSKLK